MATTKVSALTAKTTPSGSEELLINDSGTSKKITIANLPDTDTVYTHPNHSGDVVSSADGATTIQVDAVDIAMLSATGTASSTTFLRGDNTWVVPTDTDTNTNQLTTFTVSATTDTNATTISQGDDLLFTAGTGITCETTADGTVTITNTVTDTDTTYTTATASALGLIKIEDNTDQTVAANAVSATASRTYGVQLNASDQAVVNVPWTDTDTNTDTKWDGGTTGLTAATGRTSLGLVIGTDVQAYSANTAITTADTSWTGSQRATLVVDNDGSFDMNGGNNFKCTPAGNFTLTFTNITDGQSGYILLVNTGGHTVSAHANSKVDANLLATVTAAGTYLISYLSDGTNVYLTNSAIYT